MHAIMIFPKNTRMFGSQLSSGHYNENSNIARYYNSLYSYSFEPKKLVVTIAIYISSS